MLMKMFQRTTVKKNERALLLRNGSFERVLHSGTYWLFAGTDDLRVETFALEQPAFTHGLAEYLMAQEPAVVAAEFVHVNLSETEVGLRSENGVLVEILPPGTRRLYWKGLVEVSVQVVDLQAGPELPAALVARLTQTQLRQRSVTGLAGVLQVQVPEGQCGLLTVDGKVERLLTAGTYAFWKYGRTVAVELVDCYWDYVWNANQMGNAFATDEVEYKRTMEEWLHRPATKARWTEKLMRLVDAGTTSSWLPAGAVDHHCYPLPERISAVFDAMAA